MDRIKDMNERNQAAPPSGSSTMSVVDLAKASENLPGHIEAIATVVASTKTNARVNFDPILDLELTIVASGRPSYPVVVRQAVPQLHMAKVQPGSRLVAKVDPTDPSTVWLDLVNS
jgi:hypothetical protein